MKAELNDGFLHRRYNLTVFPAPWAFVGNVDDSSKFMRHRNPFSLRWREFVKRYNDAATQTSSNDAVSGYQAPITRPTDQSSYSASKKLPKPFNFTSNQDGFKAVFPNQPSREEEQSDVGTADTAKVTTYTSQKQGSNYYVFVYTYSDERMNESNPDFNAIAAMEGAINGMANQDEARLISSKKTTINGRDAYKYEIQLQNESMEGLMVYKGNRMYNIAVNYLTDNSPPSDTESYLSSLELLD